MVQLSPKPRQVVAIFRSALLPISETFILQQAEALQNFEPRFVGLSSVTPSLAGLAKPILLTEAVGYRSNIARATYQLTGFAPTFKAKIRKLKPTLLHAHFATDGVAALPLVAALRVPLIVSLHGYDVTVRDKDLASSFSGRLYLRRRKDLWRKADLFLCVSKFIRDKALEAGFPAQKLRVHYTGVDQELFQPAAVLREQGLVVFVGRLVEKKGCSYLVEAMAQVRCSVPDSRLYVIGTGPLRAQLETQAASLGLPVKFLGAKSSAEVKQWLAKAAVFCVPSLEATNGDSEGFGMVFAEAAATGAPVVSFRHGGLPEAVWDGVTGLLVEERNTHALAEALITLLRDHPKRVAFGQAGVAFVGEHFCLRKQTRALETIYSTVIEQHSSKALHHPATNATFSKQGT